MEATVNTKITLTNLTKDHVDVICQDVITIDGITKNLDLPRANAYVNDAFDRSRIKEDLPENYQAAIFAVWGETPTITDLSSQQ